MSKGSAPGAMRKVRHAHAGKRTSTHDLASQTATTYPGWVATAYAIAG